MEQEFKPARIINPGAITVPKTGTVGYVKVENKHYEGTELKPRWFEAGDYEDVGPTIGVFYPEELDEIDPLYEGPVETVNIGFHPEHVITV